MVTQTCKTQKNLSHDALLKQHPYSSNKTVMTKRTFAELYLMCQLHSFQDQSIDQTDALEKYQETSTGPDCHGTNMMSLSQHAA